VTFGAPGLPGRADWCILDGYACAPARISQAPTSGARAGSVCPLAWNLGQWAYAEVAML